MRHLMGEPYHLVFADKPGVLLVAESKSGVSGVIEMNAYRTTLDWQEGALVAFEKGWLRLELPAPLAANRAGKLEIMRDPGDGKAPETLRPVLPSTAAMHRQAENFLGVLRGERRPPCDAEEALADLKLAREYIELWLRK